MTVSQARRRTPAQETKERPPWLAPLRTSRAPHTLSTPGTDRFGVTMSPPRSRPEPEVPRVPWVTRQPIAPLVEGPESPLA